MGPPSPTTTYSKPSGRKSATTDLAHHVGSLSAMISIVVMTLFVFVSDHMNNVMNDNTEHNLLKTDNHVASLTRTNHERKAILETPI